MAYQDLREFVRKLEKEGELKRVRTEVDPNLEITEIVQRVGRDAGHGPGGGRGLRGQSGQPGMAVPHEGNYALLFEKPRGSRVPLLVNTFGSVRRMCLAFEVSELDEVAARIRGFWTCSRRLDCLTKSRCCRNWRSWDPFSRRP